MDYMCCTECAYIIIGLIIVIVMLFYMKMQVWDTAGQERFRTLTQGYYRSAHGAMIAYDLTRHSTFESLPHWIQEVEQYGAASIVVIFIGKFLLLTSQIKNILHSHARTQQTRGLGCVHITELDSYFLLLHVCLGLYHCEWREYSWFLVLYSLK